MVYIEINSANSPEVGALSNPLVCWINVPIKIAAPRSVNIRGYLYTNIVKSSFIISTIPPVSSFSFLNVAKTCLNNVQFYWYNFMPINFGLLLRRRLKMVLVEILLLDNKFNKI